MTTYFKLSGLTCEACVKLSTRRLKRLTGVQDIKINLANGETEITADHEISVQEADLVLAGSGYAVVKK